MCSIKLGGLTLTSRPPILFVRLLYMNFKDLLKELDALDLPKDQYVITSSGPLAVRGIREAHDIDLVVTPKLWEALKQKHPVKEMGLCDSIQIGNIDILGNFRSERLFTSEDQINQADVIDGHRYVNLETIIAFKKQLGRDKDKRDLELIKDYFAKLNNHEH